MNGIGLFGMQTQPRRESRDSKRIASMSQMRTALAIYKNDHGKYPGSLTRLNDYMYEIPTDPLSHKPYVYIVKNNGESYCLATELESSGKTPAIDDNCYDGSDISSGWEGSVYSIQS